MTLSVSDTLLSTNSVRSVWHDSIGYYFPVQSAVTLSVKKQSGNWHDIADPYSSALVTGKVFNLWINHGIDAKTSTYEYIVLPAVSPTQLKDYMAKQTIDILANNKKVQAVKLKDNSLFQYVFHEPARMNTLSGANFVETKNPGLVMIEITGTGNLIITVADPTQTMKEFKLTVSGRYRANQSAYNEEKNQTGLKISLPQNEFAGSSVTVELKRR
jgi:chondroitin AC lyase